MFDFDEPIERRGTGCAKWDQMEPLFGVPAADGLAMWVADMDFRPPPCVQRAVEAMAAHGVYGYPGCGRAQRQAVAWWMRTRHGWAPDPDHILTTHGLVNGTALCVDALTEPGEAVALFTPVYHAFARVIRAAGRMVTELPLALRDGRHALDWSGWESRLTGRERMLILCSPHNPGGRVWTQAELGEIAAFARDRGLVLVADEIHHDLVMPGQRHRPAVLVPGAEGAVMLTATTKTFNIAGAQIGNVTTADPVLRAHLGRRLVALGMSPNAFGLAMATAAYSDEGAQWVEALLRYLDGNRRIFEAGVAAIPGLRAMPLEATYLAWVDFRGTGLPPAEIERRLARDARIAANAGPSFGLGGEGWMRFNLGTTRARVEEALRRLRAAFGPAG